MKGRKIQVADSEGQGDCLDALAAAVEEAGGVQSFSVRHGFNVGQICGVLRYQRGVTCKIAKAIGWEKVIVYRKVSA